MTPTDTNTPMPSDVPAARPASLDQLELLVGSWQMEARFPEGAFGPGSPAVVNRDGRTSFEWLDGRFFLLQRFANDHPAAPSGIAIIGSRAANRFVQHYFDSRGVTRRYDMTVDGRQWTLQAESDGFHQRYVGEISDDRRRISGSWESSSDGHKWRHDFELIYEKVEP